jgi:hypothetical protein
VTRDSEFQILVTRALRPLYFLQIPCRPEVRCVLAALSQAGWECMNT